jgi:hypothetical protein
VRDPHSLLAVPFLSALAVSAAGCTQPPREEGEGEEGEGESDAGIPDAGALEPPFDITEMCGLSATANFEHRPPRIGGRRLWSGGPPTMSTDYRVVYSD